MIIRKTSSTRMAADVFSRNPLSGLSAQRKIWTGSAVAASVTPVGTSTMKATMPIMFALLFIAGISQLIKATMGFAGKLPDDRISETLGGDM